GIEFIQQEAAKKTLSPLESFMINGNLPINRVLSKLAIPDRRLFASEDEDNTKLTSYKELFVKLLTTVPSAYSLALNEGVLFDMLMNVPSTYPTIWNRPAK